MSLIRQRNKALCIFLCATYYDLVNGGTSANIDFYLEQI